MKETWNWIKRQFSEKSSAKNIALLIISIIITVSMATPINNFVDSLYRKKTQTVSITIVDNAQADTEPGMIGVYDSYIAPHDAYGYFLDALFDTDLTYELSYGENGNEMIFIDTIANMNKKVTFDCPDFANTTIDFISNVKGGYVKVECGNFSRVYDLYNPSGSSLVRCTPICESYERLIPYFAIYIALFVLVVLTVYIYEYILVRFANYVQTHKDDKWIKYNMKLDVIIIFIILSAFSLISYYNGTIRGYLQGGDQNHYWYMVSEIGNFMEDSKNFYDFRGYWCYLGPALCKSAGSFLGIDPVAIWIVFLNLLTAGLLGITFPMLSKKLYGYSITRLQVYFSVLVMCIFWRDLLTLVLMDLPAAVFFISGLTLYMYFLEKPSMVKGVFCGLLIAFASNLKVNYQYVSLILIVVWTLYFFLKKYKNTKSSPDKKQKVREGLKKIFSVKVIASTLSIVLAFVAVCIPQLMINKERGVMRLTPFETETSFTAMGYGDEHTLIMEYSTSESFNYLRRFPYESLTDRQVQGIMTDYVGDTSTLLRFPQLFEMFLRKPVDTLIMMMKKIIMYMNILTSSSYDYLYSAYQNSLVWLKCLLNYVIISGGTWAVFRNRKNIKEKMIFFCIFVLCLLPGTLAHVEWRGFIVGHLFVNFYFCYSLMPCFAVKSNGDTKKLNGFYKGLSFFLVFMSIICPTII